MVNQELETKGRKYHVLPSFGTCCRELGGLKLTTVCACVCSFCSVPLGCNHTVQVLCTLTMFACLRILEKIVKVFIWKFLLSVTVCHSRILLECQEFCNLLSYYCMYLHFSPELSLSAAKWNSILSCTPYPA